MKTQVVTLLALLLFPPLIQAQTLVPDANFGVDGRVETGLGIVTNPSKTILLQPDGKILVAGAQDVFPDNQVGMIRRYLLDGRLDTTFAFQTHTPGIQAATLQTDGALIGATQTGWIRVSSDGDLDSNFTGPVFSELSNFSHTQLVSLPMGGWFSTGFENPPQQGGGWYLAKFKQNGMLDSSFAQNGLYQYHPSVLDRVFDVALQSDGKIVVVGSARSNGAQHIVLYRLWPNGVLDADFGQNGSVSAAQFGAGEALDVAVDPDGKIVVAGYAHIFPEAAALVLRYHPSGSLDDGFGVNGACVVQEMARVGALARDSLGQYWASGISREGYRGVMACLDETGTLIPLNGTNTLFFPELATDTYHALSIHLLPAGGILTGSMVLNAEVAGVVLNRYVGQAFLSTQTAPARPTWVLFPNPARDFCSLLGENLPAEGQIRVQNVQGKILQQTYFKGEKGALNRSLSPDLPAGPYVLSVFSSGKRVFQGLLLIQ